MSGHILVVDDEVGIRELLSEILTDEGYDVHLAENAEAARAFRSLRRPDLVLLDIWMPDTDGVTLLKEWAGGGQLTMPVVMMSGHGTIDTAVEATRLGATDFLEKPVALAKLIDTVNKAIKRGASLPRRTPGMDLSALGRSPLILELKKRLTQIAGNTAPVLLQGEPGSGFDICAHFLHQPASAWVEIKDRARLVSEPLGFVEALGNGTLYLPEVSELARLEQKGLGLLLDRIEGSGARLVCASSRSLDTMVAAGEFDSRLFYRLSSLAIQLPPLRDHREDVPDIANFMLAQLVEEGVSPVRRLTTPALNQLRNFDWPGNLPQLGNVVRTLAVTALANEIDAVEVNRVLAPMKLSVPAVAHGIPLDIPLREARDAFERMYFEHLIQKEGGSMTRVADKSGLERTHLYRKLKQLNIRHGRRLDEEL
ncbi:sigma-54 dependent transcriptional regulator [Thiobacillus sp.]|uniref:sigma-54-dependent transcriptional regulator n=1 Tax=Thiobacillus sp. TaxID=924 RepID=UPI0025E574DF|nr:sigma-54 dependent transcriptional regulator [Thiobacillus sp.]